MAKNTVTMTIDVQNIKPIKEILLFAYAAAEKFIEKVESGKARSVETYKDMKDLVALIQTLQDKPDTQEEPKAIQEWKPYTGDYEKQFYDVKDKDGAISLVSHYLTLIDVLFLFLRPVR